MHGYPMDVEVLLPTICRFGMSLVRPKGTPPFSVFSLIYLI